jgi:hypothetical protein
MPLESRREGGTEAVEPQLAEEGSYFGFPPTLDTVMSSRALLQSYAHVNRALIAGWTPAMRCFGRWSSPLLSGILSSAAPDRRFHNPTPGSSGDRRRC